LIESGTRPAAGQIVQFERFGYFVADRLDSTPEALVFNRIVTLKDSWGKT
jgi:glutaminyl-tRNA synthetase